MELGEAAASSTPWSWRRSRRNCSGGNAHTSNSSPQKRGAHDTPNGPDEFVITEQASGAYIERDGLDRVRDLIATKQIQALIVWKVDRIARDEALVGQLIVLNEAKNAGVTVYAVDKGGPVENTMEGNLVNVVNAYVAASEKEAFRRRSIAGKRSKAMNEGVLPVGTGVGLFGYSYLPRVKRNKQTGDPGSLPSRVVNDA